MPSEVRLAQAGISQRRRPEHAQALYAAILLAAHHLGGQVFQKFHIVRRGDIDRVALHEPLDQRNENPLRSLYPTNFLFHLSSSGIIITRVIISLKSRSSITTSSSSSIWIRKAGSIPPGV